MCLLPVQLSSVFVSREKKEGAEETEGEEVKVSREIPLSALHY